MTNFNECLFVHVYKIFVEIKFHFFLNNDKGTLFPQKYYYRVKYERETILTDQQRGPAVQHKAPYPLSISRSSGSRQKAAILRRVCVTDRQRHLLSSRNDNMLEVIGISTL